MKLSFQNSFPIKLSSSCKWKPRCHPTSQLSVHSAGNKNAGRQERFQVSPLLTARDDEAAIASHFPAKPKQDAPILMAWVTGRAILHEKFTFATSKYTLDMVFCMENMVSWLCKAEHQLSPFQWGWRMVSVFAKHLCQLEEFLQFLCKVDVCVDSLLWAVADHYIKIPCKTNL